MAQFCEKNETYASLNLPIKELVAIDGRRLTGIGGRLVDRFFTRFDKRR